MGANKRARNGFTKFVFSLIFILSSLISYPTGMRADAVQAAADLTVSVGTVEGKRGEQVNVPVSISSILTGVASYGIKVNYDPTALEVVSITPLYGKTFEASCTSETGGCFASHYDNQEGWVKAVWVDSSGGDLPITEDKSLFTINLKIKETSTLGIKALTVDAENESHTVFTDHSLHSLRSDRTDGQVTVSKPHSSSSSVTPPPTKSVEKITVPVVAGNDNSIVTQTQIDRTKETNGQIQDEVTYNQDKAAMTVQKAKELGQTSARIVIPDEKDEVSQITVKIPKAATQELANGKLNLEIYTENVKITLPDATMNGLQNDLYFHVIPIKEEQQRNRVEERAKKEEVVTKEVVGANSVKVVGRPMTIETNLSSRAVDLVLPLMDVRLPTDTAVREKFLSDLRVFIEHSDGDRALVKPTIVEYNEGQLGLQFSITKFSTFTILNMEQVQTENYQLHYVSGFKDQTFKPEKNISRAEIAALLARVEKGKKSTTGSTSYRDVKEKDWAKEAIDYASSTGLMNGYVNGTFGPNQSVTRAEMAAIVSRWLGLSGDIKTNNLSDIKGNWAAKQIAQVQQAGIMKGLPNGTFQPNKTLTRAEAVVILNRILKRGPLHDVVTPTWKDVPVNHWAYKDIEEASNDHSFTNPSESGETQY